MKTDKMGRTHLVVGDVHTKPGQDFRRLDWLGQIIVERKPEVIVFIGDFADMESLSSYDEGKKSAEGRRYKADCQAAKDGMDRVLAPLRAYNEKQARDHKQRYKPEMHMILGNHENRIDRAVENDAKWDGFASMADLGYEERGLIVHPFLDEVDIDGVLYSHYFPSGVMNKAIGGEYTAATLIRKHHRSCTVGHSHVADWAQRRVGGGEHIMALVVGCYFEHEEKYVSSIVNQMWWRGLMFCHNVVDGCYDLEQLSLNTLKKRFLKGDQ